MSRKTLWSGFDNRGLYAEVADRASKDIHGNVIHEYYATKEEISHTGGYKIVAELEDGHPKVDDPSEQYIYLYRDPMSTSRDPYTEWIYQEDGNPQWQIIGDTTPDINGKADKVVDGVRGNLVVVGAGGNIADSGVASSNLVELGIQYSNSGDDITPVNKLVVVEPGYEVQLYDGSMQRLDKVYLMTQGERDQLSTLDDDLDKKANKTYVDEELDKKANKTYVDEELSTKANKTYVDEELANKISKIKTDDGELPIDPSDYSVTIPLATSDTANVYGISGLVKGEFEEFTIN